MYIAVLMAAIGQIMLKIGSGRGGIDFKLLRLNIFVATGFVAMLVSMLLSVRALSIVPLRDMAFILPAVYVLVPLFARIFLKEQIPKQTIAGTLIIVAGITVFHLPMGTLF